MITYSRLVHSLNWDKKTGLLPAIIQDSDNLRVLMLGYMNKDSLKITLKTKKVTYNSRKIKRNRNYSKKQKDKPQTWIKGIISRLSQSHYL